MNASAISIPHGHDGHSAGHDDGHGHHGPVLQYQPGLPLSRGKLIMWLFLSTEIMFFAALLGSYVVLRFGAPVWPKPHHVHLSEPIGAFNTFVLICSSVTIVLALEFARANKSSIAKFWILLTLLLGILFLGVKGYEYQAKFAHGIFPQSPRSRIYEKPDLYYGSAVRARLDELRKTPVGQVPSGLRDPADAEAKSGDTVDLLQRLDAAPADRLSADQQTARAELAAVVSHSGISPAGIFASVRSVGMADLLLENGLTVALVSAWNDPAHLVIDSRHEATRVDPINQANMPDALRAMQWLDQTTYLVDDILTKLDRANMAASLETRVALLDHRLVEFAWTLPADMKVRNGQGKWIVRQVLNRFVPAPLLDRPKMGFAIPLESWLRGPLREWASELLDERRVREQGFLNADVVAQEWRQLCAGGGAHQHKVWALLMWMAWVEHWKPTS